MTKSCTSLSSTSKKGHHHKHSTFLLPGAHFEHESLNTIFNFPRGQTVYAALPDISFAVDTPACLPCIPTHDPQDVCVKQTCTQMPLVRIHAYDNGSVAAGTGQFLLGTWLWHGQHIGSLACTGLGYWLVFSAFGVWLGSVLPSWLGFSARRERRQFSEYGVGFVSIFGIVRSPFYHILFAPMLTPYPPGVTVTGNYITALSTLIWPSIPSSSRCTCHNPLPTSRS
jgi:hypothetical protein